MLWDYPEEKLVDYPWEMLLDYLGEMLLDFPSETLFGSEHRSGHTNPIGNNTSHRHKYHPLFVRFHKSRYG
jgi:hypothetical protein